jgi:hypothetical protein
MPEEKTISVGNGGDSGTIATANICTSCHGCNGKGWVDSVYKGAMVCPVCNGSGTVIPSATKWYPVYPYQPYPWDVTFTSNLSNVDPNSVPKDTQNWEYKGSIGPLEKKNPTLK